MSESLRKAAILIRSLDAEAAAKLLLTLSAGEAKAVRLAIRQLGPIDPAERAEVATALRQKSPPASSGAENGVEVEFSPSMGLQDDHRTPEPVNSPFPELAEAEAEVIARFLAPEHPQTMAVVISYLRPVLAAKVLGELPETQQEAVIDALANLGEAPPDTLRVLAEGLASWIEAHRCEQQRQASRSSQIQAIRAAADDQLRQRIAQRLPSKTNIPAPPPVTRSNRDEYSQLAASPREVRLNAGLAVLERLEDDALLEVMRNVSGETLVLALAGARESFLRRIESRLSRPAVQQLHRRLAALSKVSNSEIEQAQSTIARVALELRMSSSSAA